MPNAIPEGAKTIAAAASPPASVDWRRHWGWLVVGLLLLLEYGLFREYAQREIVWAYPAGWDQVAYLLPSYETYEHILQGGLQRGLKYGLGLPTAKGPMMYVQAALLYLVLGPSRLSALTLNFLYFALLQCALAGTARWYSGRWSVALFALGLLLAASALLSRGGIMDFRIDFIAMCLFGTFLCATIRSRLFALWGWSAAVGGVGALLVLFRSLTLLYLAGVLGTIFFTCGVGLLLCRRETAALWNLRRRLVGLVLAGLVLLLLTVPSLWRNQASIRAYYLNHLSNGESTERNIEFGVNSTADRLLYYPRSIVYDHAGNRFLELGGLALASALVVGLYHRAKKRGNGMLAQPGPRGAAAFALACLLIPLVMLTLYGSPSPVVANIVVPALVWLAVVLSLWLARLRGASGGGRFQTAWAGTLAVLALGTGCFTYADALSQHGRSACIRDDVAQVQQLYDEMARYSHENCWRCPVLACNDLHEALGAHIAEGIIYERQHVLLPFRQSLPASIMATTEKEALAALSRSDFVIMNMGPLPENLDRPPAPYTYPFVTLMREMRPQMLATCEREFLTLGHFHVFGDGIVLFARPGARVTGATPDGWVTSGGLTVTVRPEDLRRFPRLELQGKDRFALLGKVPAVEAELQVPGQTNRSVPAKLVADGTSYTIIVDFDPDDVPHQPSVVIRLTFDDSFCPRDKIKGSTDPRYLVMTAPSQTRLLPRP